MEFRTKCEATRYIGGLSNPEKMPCPAWNLQPLATCPMGATLARMPGSVCSVCYGTSRKSRYVRFHKSMKKAWDKRLLATQEDGFVDAMVRLIANHEYFRWHDTGDVYCAAYWEKILAICEQTPDTKHWLPTKEYWLNGIDVPDNLCVRFSLPFVDAGHEETRLWVANYGRVSTVSTTESPVRCSAIKVESRAYDGVMVQYCGDCRRCWDKDEPVVDYHRHTV